MCTPNWEKVVCHCLVLFGGDWTIRRRLLLVLGEMHQTFDFDRIIGSEDDVYRKFGLTWFGFMRIYLFAGT